MGNTQRDSVDRPVFLVGMPRSGTTLLFESFARNQELGWFSYQLERFPWLPPVAGLARLCDVSEFFRKEVSPSDEAQPWLERFRDGPSEAYSVWERCCGEKFLYDYLLDTKPSDEERERVRRLVARVLRWQGKSRFAAKLTGPSRLGFVQGLFPDARFVHIVRDGRAVASSLLRVGFWKDTWRLREPAWRGGLKDAYLEAWEAHDRSPLVLAALQWRNVVERTWEERERSRPEVFLEVRYEDFLAAPVATLEGICEATEVAFSSGARRWLETQSGVRPAGEGFRRHFSAGELALLDDLLGDLLERLGYSRNAEPA